MKILEVNTEKRKIGNIGEIIAEKHLKKDVNTHLTNLTQKDDNYDFSF